MQFIHVELVARNATTCAQASIEVDLLLATIMNYLKRDY